MDETPKVEEPEVAPINWSNLHPKLTKAIVQAQRLATTVDSDGQHPTQGWRYPTQAAIACKAREAMGAAGIAIVQIGWKKGKDGIYGEFCIVHEDGPVSPVFGAAMAIPRNNDETKAIAASISILRKYVIAGILNMGWRDPREDSEGNPQPGKKNSQQKGAAQTQRRQQQPQPQPQPQPRRPNPVEEHRANALKAAQAWWKWLVEKGIAKGEVLRFVSGLDGEMSKPAPTSILEAIALAGKVLSHGPSSDGLPAINHSQLMSFMTHCDVGPLWCDGKKTPAGDSVDQKWPIGQ